METADAPSGMAYHLAQVNVARMRAPLDSPVMAWFVARLDAINARADASPGFVWRLQTKEGDATTIRAFEDETILLNMSVWESLDALQAYVYQGAHAETMSLRREWFEPPHEAHLALWWIPAGHIPTVDEAVERLDHIRRVGPTEFAFSFRRRFPAPACIHSTTAVKRGPSLRSRSRPRPWR